jgi:predicted esterase
MMKKLLIMLFSLLLAGCGQGAPEPEVPALPGSISGVIKVKKPKRSLIYLALGKSYDELTLGMPVRLGLMRKPGPFRFKQIPPGAYYLGAFVDINGNRIPDVPAEPYFLSRDPIRVSPGEHVKDILVDGFFNERNPSFKSAERIRQYENLLQNANTSVGNTYEQLTTDGSDLLLTVMPTLRAMIYEAESVWSAAGNEADWEHITALLAPIADLAAAAKRGNNPLASQRGFQLRAYISGIDSSIQRYAVYVPDAYDGSRPFPLVIALHGAGGDHWAGMKMVLGSSALVIGAQEANTRFFPRNPPADFIVACPNGHGYRGPGYRKSGEYDVLKVIRDMISNYNIDTDRVYLTGSSKGGRGAWEIGLKYPEMFAAIAPVCGGTDVARTLVKNAARVRIYAFHGSRDRFVSVNESRAMSLAVYATGLPVEYEYKELEEFGHEAGMLVYQGGMIFEVFRKS